MYFCCLEALQNAAKHAPDARVAIAVREDDGAAALRGAPTTAPASTSPPATAGHGYVNMSDRLGAIGGTVEWRSAPGEGAEIAGTIPLS